MNSCDVTHGTAVKNVLFAAALHCSAEQHSIWLSVREYNLMDAVRRTMSYSTIPRVRYG